MIFSTPEDLVRWHLDHKGTPEQEDYAEVGDTRCPWCKCKIYKAYHESGCPVRELMTKRQSQKPTVSNHPSASGEPQMKQSEKLKELAAWMMERYANILRAKPGEYSDVVRKIMEDLPLKAKELGLPDEHIEALRKELHQKIN